jgi:hypothetical protein
VVVVKGLGVVVKGEGEVMGMVGVVEREMGGVGVMGWVEVVVMVMVVVEVKGLVGVVGRGMVAEVVTGWVEVEDWVGAVVIRQQLQTTQEDTRTRGGRIEACSYTVLHLCMQELGCHDAPLGVQKLGQEITHHSRHQRHQSCHCHGR